MKFKVLNVRYTLDDFVGYRLQQWNALPENFKNARNVKQFKQKYLSQESLPCMK